MVTFSRASIVVVPFPFSDLSGTKLRPAIVLGKASHDDWLLCQVTSQPYTDPSAIRITNTELRRGSLRKTSYARPTKIFTASSDLVVKHVAILSDEPFRNILASLIATLQQNIPTIS